MNSIGIISSNKYIMFCILDLKNNKIINVETLKKPLLFNNSKQLNHLRLVLNDIIEEYNVKIAGLKGLDYNKFTSVYGKKSVRERIENETIIQEVFVNSNICDYLIGVNSNLSSLFDINPKVFKIFFDKDKKKLLTLKKEDKEHYETSISKINNIIPDIESYSIEKRKAILIAYAAGLKNEK